jgi:uncharacterized protein YqjF (DUF2071 family)
MQRFLTAEWRDLVMANYEVSPESLAGLVPTGTSLDFHDGRLFVSLVGFMFLRTRVLGIPIPFHINFEEVNLRFYVKREMPDETRRGVCFVKEIVPRLAIATVARVLYGEPYECWKMSHHRTENEVAYTWSRGGAENSVSIEIDQNLGVPTKGSEGEFIIEHYWGYTRRGGGRTDEYKVEHPPWQLFSVRNPRIEVDFGATYGESFAFLKNEKPHSVLLAKGSPIAVYKGTKMKS